MKDKNAIVKPKRKKTGLPYDMELGKKYKFIYGVDSCMRLVKEPIEEEQ